MTNVSRLEFHSLFTCIYLILLSRQLSVLLILGFSKLMVDVKNERAEILVDVASIGVETLSYVFKCLKEAIEIHLGVLAAPHHVLVNDVVVGLADVRVGHVFKLRQPLELIRRYKVIVFLARKDFKDCLSL